MSMNVNMVVESGATFTTTIALADLDDNDIDLSVYTASGYIRKTYTSLTYVPFETSITDSEITLTLTATTTAEMEAGRYVYDIILTHINGTIVRIVEGIITVTPGVTY